MGKPKQKTDDERMRFIALTGIESQSGWMRRGANELGFYCKMLVARPKFETRAEAAMEDAEKAIVEALETVRAARQRYRELKKDGSET